MATIKLGQRPKTFKHTVNFLQLDKSPGSIDITYTYRDRAELATFSDACIAEVKAEQDAELAKVQAMLAANEPVPELTQEELLSRELWAKVKYIMACVEGWNLDVPFDAAAVRQLAIEVPAAIPEIIADYRRAIDEGRTGN